jgi:hypothetical protein
LTLEMVNVFGVDVFHSVDVNAVPPTMILGSGCEVDDARVFVSVVYSVAVDT